MHGHACAEACPTSPLPAQARGALNTSSLPSPPPGRARDCRVLAAFTPPLTWLPDAPVASPLPLPPLLPVPRYAAATSAFRPVVKGWHRRAASVRVGGNRGVGERCNLPGRAFLGGCAGTRGIANTRGSSCFSVCATTKQTGHSGSKPLLDRTSLSVFFLPPYYPVVLSRFRLQPRRSGPPLNCSLGLHGGPDAAIFPTGLHCIHVLVVSV